MTFSLAFSYAAKVDLGDDQRIHAFAKQIELLQNCGVEVDFIRKLEMEYNALLGFKLFDV